MQSMLQTYMEKAIMKDITKMTEEEFDEWFTEDSKLYPELIIKEIESDHGYKDAPGLSPEAREKLIKYVEEMENGK